MNAGWNGLSKDVRELFTKCMTRRVRIVIKQETNIVRLIPPIAVANLVPVQPMRNLPAPGAKASKPEADSPEASWPEQTLSAFRLKQVLYGSGVLRTSSDVSRVHVTRTDPATKQKQEWTLDLTRLPPETKAPENIAEGQDLWLRDGDLVEVVNLAQGVKLRDFVYFVYFVVPQ